MNSPPLLDGQSNDIAFLEVSDCDWLALRTIGYRLGDGLSYCYCIAPLNMGNGVTDEFGNNENLRFLCKNRRNGSIKKESKENKETHIRSLAGTSLR